MRKLHLLILSWLNSFSGRSDKKAFRRESQLTTCESVDELVIRLLINFVDFVTSSSKQKFLDEGFSKQQLLAWEKIMAVKVRGKRRRRLQEVDVVIFCITPDWLIEIRSESEVSSAENSMSFCIFSSLSQWKQWIPVRMWRKWAARLRMGKEEHEKSDERTKLLQWGEGTLLFVMKQTKHPRWKHFIFSFMRFLHLKAKCQDALPDGPSDVAFYCRINECLIKINSRWT